MGEPQYPADEQQRGSADYDDLVDARAWQTIYCVLGRLEADDWLCCEGKTWYLDIKAEMLGDVNDRNGTGRGMSFVTEDILGE
ncbi:hypothetical protein [Halovenus sp. HT40]|uniref:hypothetical protein n=1 Tax=Halovenus sp. HT40 TaxID=3126691 RepID=UPI00300EA397